MGWKNNIERKPTVSSCRMCGDILAATICEPALQTEVPPGIFCSCRTKACRLVGGPAPNDEDSSSELPCEELLC